MRRGRSPVEEVNEEVDGYGGSGNRGREGEDEAGGDKGNAWRRTATTADGHGGGDGRRERRLWKRRPPVEEEKGGGGNNCGRGRQWKKKGEQRCWWWPAAEERRSRATALGSRRRRGREDAEKKRGERGGGVIVGEEERRGRRRRGDGEEPGPMASILRRWQHQEEGPWAEEEGEEGRQPWSSANEDPYGSLVGKNRENGRKARRQQRRRRGEAGGGRGRKMATDARAKATTPGEGREGAGVVAVSRIPAMPGGEV